MMKEPIAFWINLFEHHGVFNLIIKSENMKKVFISVAALLCAGILFAQTPANRTTKTVVADVLAQMPVAKQAEYDKLMGELSSVGEDGVLMLIKRINSPGKGSNANVEYALSGLTHYVAANGKEEVRKVISNAYLKALEQTDERETKAFIIRQLQILGQDECVETLALFLNDEALSGPAARALVSIDTPSADAVLVNALKRRAGSIKTQRDVIEAVGDAQIAEAEEIIGVLLNAGNPDLQDVLLYALGKVGSLNSLDILAQAAANDNYRMDKKGATEAYIALINRLIAQGHLKEATKAAQKLQKEAVKAGEEQIRIAALQILLHAESAKGAEDNSKSIKLIMTALKDDSRTYRNAALDFASDFSNEDLYIKLLQLVDKSESDLKVDLLEWFRRAAADTFKRNSLQNLNLSSKRSAEDVFIEQLSSADFNVKQAAAWLLVRMGAQSSVPLLASLLKNEDKQVVLLGQDALAAFPGAINDAVVAVLPTATDAGKIAGLELLSMRKAVSGLSAVLGQITSTSPEVKKTAYATLKDVVEKGDFDKMCEVLEAADTDARTSAQLAVISSLSSLPVAEQLAKIKQRMSQAGSKDYLYYRVLAATNTPESVEVIVKSFYAGKGEKRDAAFEALLGLKNEKVSNELYKICKENSSSDYFDRGLSAYIEQVSNPAFTGEKRLLNLRKAMEIARTDAQKKTILQQIEKTGTFLGMLYAGEFLDQKSVQQAAANAVMNIALNNKQYTGDNVRSLLNKVIEVLDNPDASYQKEAIRKHLNEMPKGEGFVSMFNGKDLTGWKGLVGNPITRAKMSASQLAKAQEKADEAMRRDWKVENGLLMFDGSGYDNLCTIKQYGDFEMYVDWMLDPAGPEADAGIYLRGTPQVQIWDTARTNVGAQVGSGGLYNNQVNESKPSKVADNPLGEWNSFYIKMVGDRVTVMLNGEKVVDDVILENYWDRNLPIFPIEQIELQAHGSKVYYRNLYIKELERKEPFKLSAEEKKEGFEILFDGTNMHEWTGNTVDYTMEDNCISMNPSKSFGGNLYTKKEYDNFVLRFEFQLTPGANNGVGIRTPMGVDAAYHGMEIQILDCEHPIYKDITPLQHHGSVYGIIPANSNHTKAIKPVGEWNTEEIVADGDNIRVTVNGVVILEGNIREATKNGTADGQQHPGLFNKKGHIGFLGHGSPLKFRNIRIKELK